MNTKSAADAYLQGAVENAPPVKIIRMLYQGALRFLGQAIEAEPGSIEFRDRISNVDDIVTELRLALVSGPDPVLCEQLESLYLFVESRLIQATRDQEVEPLTEARQILTTLAEAWKQIELQTT